MSDLDRLVLGTAKLGLPDYPPGTRHHVSAEDSLAILRRAWALGIRRFDTARHYGDAEDLLQVAGIGGAYVTVITKLRPAIVRRYSQGTETEADAVLLHSPTAAQLADEHLMSDLRFSAAGANFGASVYTPEEARAALAAGLTVLQVPYHLLDRRFEPIFEEAHAQGATVYARQPFARGRLDILAEMFLEPIRDGVDDPGAPWSVMPEVALRFALASAADAIVFGVSSLVQLEEAVRVVTTLAPSWWPDLYAALKAIDLPPLQLPSVWSQG